LEFGFLTVGEKLGDVQAACNQDC